MKTFQAAFALCASVLWFWELGFGLWSWIGWLFVVSWCLKPWGGWFDEPSIEDQFMREAENRRRIEKAYGAS